jgi:hypothetical protein
MPKFLYFQERSKYIEVEGHFESDMVMRKKIMALSQIIIIFFYE